MKISKIPKGLIVFIITAFICMQTSVYAFNLQDIELDMRTSVSVGFDDNITFVKDNEKEDFITNLSFGLGAKYEGKMRSVEVSANIAQQIFADYDDYNNTSEDLTVDFKQEFSKYDRIHIRNKFSHTYEPRSLEDAFGRTTGRYSYYRNRFMVDYSKDFTKQFSLKARYGYEVDEISRSDLQDSNLNTAGIEADYFLSSATIFLLSYDFAQREFDPGNNATTHTIGTGIRHYLTKQLYFDGRAGVDFIESYNGLNYERPRIQASITNDIDENTRASVSFSKRYYTNSYSEDLFDLWQIAVNFSRQFLERLRGSISAFYGKGEYISVNVKEELSGVNVGLIYDVKENVQCNLFYEFANVDSNNATSEYTKNTVYFGVSIKF